MLYRLQISLTNYEVLRKIIALDSSRQYVLHKENVTHTTVCHCFCARHCPSSPEQKSSRNYNRPLSENGSAVSNDAGSPGWAAVPRGKSERWLMPHTKGGNAPRPPRLEQLRQETPLSGKEEEEVRKAAPLATQPGRPRLTRKQKEEGSRSLNHSSQDLLRKEKMDASS